MNDNYLLVSSSLCYLKVVPWGQRLCLIQVQGKGDIGNETKYIVDWMRITQDSLELQSIFPSLVQLALHNLPALLPKSLPCAFHLPCFPPFHLWSSCLPFLPSQILLESMSEAFVPHSQHRSSYKNSTLGNSFATMDKLINLQASAFFFVSVDDAYLHWRCED